MNDQMLALLNLLQQSERKTLQQNLDKQLRQMQKLIEHAITTVPFYKTFYEGHDLNNVPILTRDHIQQAGDDFKSQNMPSFNGECYPMTTSGTTGKFVTVLATDLTRLFYDALMLREHAWHNRDYSKKLMSIRWAKRGYAEAPVGHYQTTWGPPINEYKETGPSILINVASEVANQIEALLIHKPAFLSSYPSQLTVLAEYCIENFVEMPFLEELRMTGETLSDQAKKIMKRAWPKVKITDVYSCVEIGNIAQQCPEYGNYHITVENVFLEIVDEDGRPCAKHVPGRVLITSLINYATPLIRYELGDYGVLGDDCPCGRGLPVLKRIEGRKRNRLILPNGESRFPYLGEREEFYKIVNMARKFQYVQHSVNDIELKAVIFKGEQVTKAQEDAVKKYVQKNFGHPFNITITYHDDIPLGPTGKYEEFISHVRTNALVMNE